MACIPKYKDLQLYIQMCMDHLVHSLVPLIYYSRYRINFKCLVCSQNKIAQMHDHLLQVLLPDNKK